MQSHPNCKLFHQLNCPKLMPNMSPPMGPRKTAAKGDTTKWQQRQMSYTTTTITITSISRTCDVFSKNALFESPQPYRWPRPGCIWEHTSIRNLDAFHHYKYTWWTGKLSIIISRIGTNYCPQKNEVGKSESWTFTNQNHHNISNCSIFLKYPNLILKTLTKIMMMMMAKISSNLKIQTAQT